MKKGKIIVSLISLLLAFGVLFGTACKTNKPDDSDNTVKPIAPVADVESHRVEGTLHQVNVDYDNPIGDFAKGGRTEYKIVTAASFGTAAKKLSKYLEQATGAVFRVEMAEEYDLQSGKVILFGVNETIKKVVTVPTFEELGEQGYYIKTVGDDVVVYCTTENGAQLAMIALLRAVVGFDMFSIDCVCFEKDGEKLPTMEIKERPDYEYRIPSNVVKDEAKYGMGFSMTKGMLKTDIGEVHNIYDFYKETDLTEHPKWFSDGAQLFKVGESGKSERVRIGQPCFTAHGDKDEYEALITSFANAVIEQLKAQPGISNIRISQNDVLHDNLIRRCTCEACKASYEYYGKTLGGAMLSFTNDVAAKVNEYIDREEPGRVVNLVVLAYGESVQAPVKRQNGDYVLDENKKGIPIARYDFAEDGTPIAVLDEDGNPKKLVCERGVAYEFAASGAKWIHSFYEPINREHASAVEAWAGLGSSNLYVWAYEISYYQYLYPYNNYEIMLDNFRYFKEFGGNFIYPEGTWENDNNPGFTKLRDYINSKGMFDVNTDYNTIIDKFFKYYFREAAPIMRKYFNEVQVILKDNEDITGGGVHMYSLSSSKVWKEGLLTNWLNSFDEARKAVKVHEYKDEKLYNALMEHILIESLFPRYVLCTKYASSYGEWQLKEMRREFIKDFEALGNTTHQEHFVIGDVTINWILD